MILWILFVVLKLGEFINYIMLSVPFKHEYLNNVHSVDGTGNYEMIQKKVPTTFVLSW